MQNEKRSRTECQQDRFCFWWPVHSSNRLEFDLMDNIFRKLIENNFSDLAGLTVDASVPVPERIINEIIQVSLQGNKNVTECHVSIGGQNKISAIIKTPLWPWPINIKLKLERIVDIIGSPMVRASLENNVLLGQLGALIKALPNGINIHENQVIIDVRSLLETPEQRRILDLVKSIEIKTEQAKLILDIKIKVEQE